MTKTDTSIENSAVKSEMDQIKFDATDQRLGRLASAIAVALMGKDRSDYAPNKIAPVQVVVDNVDQLDISDKKASEKTYQSYSGYPGGLKEVSMNKVIEKKGKAEVLRKAVLGMLPKNKLQKPRILNLIINE